MKRLIVILILLATSISFGAQITIDDITNNDTPKKNMIDIDTNFTELYGKWTSLSSTHDTAAELNALYEAELNNSAGLLAALSDETGTGVSVFSISPILVTPELGTITSGVGTALTALDGENIQDDTIDDDSIDFTDVTLLDFGLAATHDTAGELDALYEGELDNSAGLLAALSDETGTGVAVFATSPTLVTPALGTPSALVLTNATGYEGTAVISTGEGGGTKYLREDGDGTCSWQTPAGSGDVSKVGTPVNGQLGVWTGDGTIEGDADLVFETSTDTLTIAASGDLAFGVVNILTDAAGTTTLNNIDAIDATTEIVLEAALELESLQGAVTDGQVPNDITITNLSGTNTGDNSANTTYAIGSQTQAYDADTAKLDVPQTWSAAQTFDDNIFILESASADADVAGDGQLWVKNDAPNTLWFTDDAGTDFQLGTGSGDLLADGTIPLTANWDVGAYTITGTQLISDIAIGTAPLVVTSTTVVTNLNADTVDGVSVSGSNTGDEVAADLTTSGVIEIATGAEAVTGTDATRAVSPDALTDRMAAPGAIGGTTAAAAEFTTLISTDFDPTGDVDFTAANSVSLGVFDVTDTYMALRATTTATDYFELGAYDVDGTAYKGLIRFKSGNTVYGFLGDNETNAWRWDEDGALAPQGTASIDLPADTVVTADIDDDQLDSNHYIAGSIDLEHMASQSVDSDNIVDATIAVGDMAVNSIDSDQYVDASIDNAHLANSAVDTEEIAADAVEGTKIADDQVDSEHYVAASIDNEHLADNAVGVDELATDSVTQDAFDADGDFATTGSLSGQSLFTTDASGVITLTVNAVNYGSDTGKANIPTGACDAAADVGNWVVLISSAADQYQMTSDDESNQFIIAANAAALTANDELDVDGTMVSVMCIEAELWKVVGYMGAIPTDGGTP